MVATNRYGKAVETVVRTMHQHGPQGLAEIARTIPTDPAFVQGLVKELIAHGQHEAAAVIAYAHHKAAPQRGG